MRFACFTVGALSIGLSHALLYLVNFARDPVIDGYWPTSEPLDQTNSGLVGCAQFCAQVSGCVSFFHAEKEDVCECQDTLYGAGSIPGLSTKETAGYYENKGKEYAGCPPDDLSFRYKVFPDGSKFQFRFLTAVAAANFNTAVSMCSAVGGSLFQVVELEKFEFMRQIMETCPGYLTKPFWVDGVKNTTTGYWETLTGARLEMTRDFWPEGKPDNYGGDQNCVRMGVAQSNNHKLNDRPCYETAKSTYALCEKQ